ncbi:hypothetical protein K32_27700 [Kaistia sp. 32K]|uniref:hypothetical protein n=1 Tax=Kaistia sp. 32K TaxID=2795690 RepID=UPI0019380161|nr:hypothetical protein [Kaistia sp. 32K]BCP54153.1 hypothetical protein K32_27700 [Kaistia sp. 32K]
MRIVGHAVRQLLLAIFLILPALVLPAMAEGCPEQPPCRGCGCKGGPGYRGPDGRCVGFRALYKVCGDPPESRCVFENAPGAGANRECAQAKPSKQGRGQPADGILPSISGGQPVENPAMDLR